MKYVCGSCGYDQWAVDAFQLCRYCFERALRLNGVVDNNRVVRGPFSLGDVRRPGKPSGRVPRH